MSRCRIIVEEQFYEHLSRAVQFKAIPAGAELDNLTTGPYLTAPGETYEVAIGENLLAGVYNFVCTPHEFMGMTGTITVESS